MAINGAASMWARNFTIGQKKNEHLVRNVPTNSIWLLYQFPFALFKMLFYYDFQVVTNMNTTDLEVLSTMAEEGKLKPVVL